VVFDLLLLVYATGVGFAIAGLISTLYQLITTRPARFPAPDLSSPGLALSMLASAITGPFIIMRGAIRSRLEEHRPIGWLAAGAVLSTVWAACSGVLLLDLILTVGHSLA
jgi:hypothetical protein